MTAKEGWFEDPAGAHEYRWFSAGTPTELVRDGDVTSHSPISITDPEVYKDLPLEHPPDDAPLLHQPSDRPPHFELLNFGDGPVPVINTNADQSGINRGAGATERIVVMLPVLVGFFVVPLIGAAIGWLLICAAASLLLAIAGRVRRDHRR